MTAVPPQVRELLAQMQAQERETRETARMLRLALDDVMSSLEASRQLRAELAGLLTSEAPPGLVVEETGCCGRIAVTR